MSNLLPFNLLFTQTLNGILQECSLRTDTLYKNKNNIIKFDDLCKVLRQGGIKFEIEVDADEMEINYHMRPAMHGDYLALVEALANMGGRRTTLNGPYSDLDIVSMEPEAPSFWLHIPNQPIEPLTLQQAAGQCVASEAGHA